ncbi:MAG: SDR family oxidoreductase [Bacteroidia bacterium]|nr:SDR family oxidoreductase [Bacteroidia bacterium]
MKISLKDNVILLTGGSRGIGAGIAEALGECGATVAIHYRNSEESARELAQKIGNGSKAFQADLQIPEACKNLFTRVKETYGKVDSLINNAGIALEMDEEGEFETWLKAWQQTLQVNLLASAILSREAIGHFKQNGGGRIVFVSSRAAFRGDTTEFMAYAASKGGMVALHRSIARGLGKDNIKSFLVAPGFIQTDMAQQFIDQYGEEYVIDDLALNELTQPKDLAPTICFLVSGFMDHATGCSIDVNAGSYVH